MLANPQIVEKLFSQAKALSPEYRLRLVPRIIQTLVESSNLSEPKPLSFGEFSGDENSMSKWNDFSLAEWQPTDEELDGA